jgi:cellobiose transport system substrate-binding protein
MLRRLPKGLFVLLVVLTLVAAACSSDDSGDSGDSGDTGETTTTTQGGGDTGGEEIVLDLWTFGAMCLDTVIAEWAEDNPGVSVEIKESGYDEHHEALFAALATGEVPDMGAVEVGYSSLFRAAPDQFVDLNTLGAQDIKDDYLPWRWEHGVAADGRVIGIPTDTGGMAVAYRTDLFEAAGLPTDRDEVSALWPTWDDFIAVGEQFVANSDTKFIDSAGTVYDAVLRQGQEMYYTTPDGDGNSELIIETNPQNLKAWDIAMATIDSGLTAAYSNFSPEWNAAMANGDYAVLMAPAWMMGYIQGQAPDTAGMWDIASMPEGGGNWGGTQLTIPARSDHPELTYDLISYVLAPEQQLKVFNECGNFPSTPEVYETEAIQGFTNEFFSNAPVGKIYAAGVAELFPIYEGPDQRAIGREFGNGIDRVQQGLEDAATAWQSTLDAIKLEVGG